MPGFGNRRADRLLALLAAVVATLALAHPAAAERIGATGDISPPPNETTTNDHRTATLAAAQPYTRIILAGDTQYEQGTIGQYRDPHGWVEPGGWSRLDAKAWPVVGNHEGSDPAGAYAGFCAYFTGVGRPTGCGVDLDHNGHPDGVWVTQLAGWTFVFLNSGCGDQPGSPSCASGSPQYWWANHVLKNVAHELDPGIQCTALVFHEPFKSSPAPYTGEPKMTSLWSLGVRYNVDLAISGHNHALEQLKPYRASGIVDYDSGPGDGDDGLAGIRSVVAGGGGRSLRPFTGVDPRSLYRRSAFGLWEADFRPGGWTGRFRLLDGRTEFDRAVGCH